MSLIVHKHGGSSLADDPHLARVAERMLDSRRAGHDVVVVAAMGATTQRQREQALTCVIDPAPVEPAIDLLHERPALAEAR